MVELKDLRKINPDLELVVEQGESRIHLPVEVSDLVEALKAEGYLCVREDGAAKRLCEAWEGLTGPNGQMPRPNVGSAEFMLAVLGEDA